MSWADKRAVTLVELILATLLLSVVVLAGVSMELGLRRIYRSTDDEAVLLGEATQVMSRVVKTISLGIGDISNPPFASGTTGGGVNFFDIRTDSNVNARPDAGDIWVRFGFSPAGNISYYCADNATNFNSCEVLSRCTTAFSIAAPVAGVGTSAVTIVVTRDPTAAPGYGNPNLTLRTMVQYRSLSLT